MRRFLSIWVLGILIATSGCAATQQAKSVEKSGFLDQKTYSMLKEGKRSSGFFSDSEEDQALMIYINPNAQWRTYRKFNLDPVTLFVGKDSPLSKVKPEDRKMLATTLWSNLDEQLRKDYERTTELGPNTLWFQVAVTEAGESNVVLDTISSLIPQAKMLAGVKSLATGVSAFSGEASAELKLTDAATGELLAAAVDRRGGTKSLSGVTDSWHDVTESYRFWAEKVRYRLCQLRGGINCVKPKA
jgi:hypothetical protein